MMQVTDRHFRVFLRAITKHSLLYTEMITAQALAHGDVSHLLRHEPIERPLALQTGGDDPKLLAHAARLAEQHGYDEVNLNVGCPSAKVQRGSFGACLMKTPRIVAEGVAAMRAAVALPVTVKHRIGVDDLDRYEDLARFVEIVAPSGCDRFIVHARKAWLQGLSPKENRSVPPLRHEDVYRLKADFPELPIEINGGIKDLDTATRCLEQVDGVMIGRAARDDPWIFAAADRLIFGRDGATPPDRHAIVEALLPYIEAQLAAGQPLGRLVRGMLPLFAGQPGARRWRRHLSEQAHADGAGISVVIDALSRVPRPRVEIS